MKRLSVSWIIIATLLFIAGEQLAARGPGGGGGRGGGGGGGGARAAGGGGAARPSAGTARSPAISAPAARPSTGAGAARPNVGTGAARPNPGGGVATRPATGAGNRPSASQLNQFIDVGRPSTGAIGVDAGRGGAAADFLGGGARPSQLPAHGAGVAAGVGSGIGAGAARQNLANNRPSRIQDRQQLQDGRQQRRNEIRDQIKDNHPRLDFWSQYPNWAAWRINRPYRWATWAALTGWFGWGSGSSETAYAYGDNVYYHEDQVYYGEQPVATAEDYANQAAAIAAEAPQDLNPQNSEWLPLGVFAVTQDREATGPVPTLFMQLAVNKEGVIAGTFKNETTGETQSLEGMVDKKSQRVAWCSQGKSWPIVETGLSNLTQDSVPVLVHFADGETQQWLLVRLEEPKSS